MQNAKSTKTLGYSLLALGVAVVMGLAAPFIKLGLRHMSVFYLLALRFTLGALLFVAVFARRIARGLRGAKLGTLLGLSLLTAASLICSNIALTMTSATNTVFLQSVSIVLVPLAARILLKQRIRPVVWPIILLVALGMFLMYGGVSFSFGLSELLLLANATMGALVFVLSSKYLKGCDWVVLSFSQVFVTAVVFWITAAATKTILPFSALPTEAWLIVLFLGVCSCFLMYLGQNVALTHLPPTLVSLLFCSQSVFAAGSAYLILGERLSPQGALGAGVILLGVVLATLFANGRPARRQPVSR